MEFTVNLNWMNEMNVLIFDTETLPSSDPDVIESLRKSIRPPGNITKTESIDKWIAENAESKLAELVAKTSLDGGYGSIACIAWKLGNDLPVQTTNAEMVEEEVIKAFYDAVENSAYITDSFCGHNVQFDFQFLKHRSIILGIKPPKIFLDAMNSKPWEEKVFDTQYMWTNDRNKYISLHALCQILGIPDKGDFDGSMVAETWPVDPKKVIDYCTQDVQRTYEVFKRITFD